MIKDSIKELNGVLKELILGILIIGILFQTVFMWFVSDKWFFSTGLWIGVAMAVFMAIHMNFSVERSLERQEKDATGYMQKMVVIRMLGVIVLLGLSYAFRLGNVVSIFAGMFTLKLGAYLQPALHRMLGKKYSKGR